MATKAVTRYRTRFVRRPRSRSKSKTTIPLAVVAGFVPLATFAYEGYQAGGLYNAAARVAQRLTGYDSTYRVFIPAELMKGWGPILAGFGVHWLASRIGINRALGRAGVPLLRL